MQGRCAWMRGRCAWMQGTVSTACYGRRCAICRCPRRPKGRPWPPTTPESGEWRISLHRAAGPIIGREWVLGRRRHSARLFRRGLGCSEQYARADRLAVTIGRVRSQLAGLLRQSVFGRLAGYEDVNDAERLCRDRAMRCVVRDRAITGAAASASQMGRFETRWLSRSRAPRFPDQSAPSVDRQGAPAAAVEDCRAPTWIIRGMSI
jgi:hypothetical protein